jgi:hypothetical protein
MILMASCVVDSNPQIKPRDGYLRSHGILEHLDFICPLAHLV